MRWATPLTLVSLSLAIFACGESNGQAPGDGVDADYDGVVDGNEDTSGLGPMTTVSFDESTEDFVNPERGYYVGYNLRGAGDASFVRNGGHSIAISVVKLDDYIDRPLDAALLTSLENGFQQARAAGIKIILRFTYNLGFDPDAPLDVVLGHIEQLRPVLQANADVITVMQAGFVGAWGEWHSSTNGLTGEAEREQIIDALLDALPADRNVQLRTPMFKDAYVPGGALDETEAYTGSARARLGHHNDCFLASATDYGTYDSPVEQWENYVSDDARFTAAGGETCAVYEPKTDCAAATQIMETLHWSYLNSQYNVNVLDEWVAQGCADEIRRRMGYRFALDSVTHNESVAPGGELAVEVTLHNAGYASPYNERPVEVVLTDGTTRHVARLEGLDPRRWSAGESRTFSARLRVPADLAPGSYTLALRLPDAAASLADDARFALRLANDGTWDAATGDNVLTRALVIDPAAVGPRDESATELVQLP